MTQHTFSLIPFPNANPPELEITGSVSRCNDSLTIEYFLGGDIRKIVLPERSGSPKRKDGLWAATCFEFFLAPPADPQYWEFNLSPAGDWNIYHMEAYRRVGFRTETAIQRVKLDVETEARSISIHAQVDLGPLTVEDRSLQMGISCVIQSIDIEESYWALVHPHPMPDFHVRDSFILRL